jgi:hypothetical protein
MNSRLELGLFIAGNGYLSYRANKFSRISAPGYSVAAVYFCAYDKCLFNEAGKLLNCGIELKLLLPTRDTATAFKHLLPRSILNQYQSALMARRMCSFS